MIKSKLSKVDFRHIAVHHCVTIIDTTVSLTHWHPDVLRMQQRQGRMRLQPQEINAREDDAVVLEAGPLLLLSSSRKQPACDSNSFSTGPVPKMGAKYVF